MKLMCAFVRFQVRVYAKSFLPIGVMLLLGSFALLLSEVQFARSARHANGKITAMERRADSDGKLLFYPHFTFAKPDGTLEEIVSNVGTQPESFEVGQYVPVLFKGNEPGAAKIATTFQVYGVGLTLLIIGAVFVPIGLLFRYLRRRFFPV